MNYIRKKGMNLRLPQMILQKAQVLLENTRRFFG